MARDMEDEVRRLEKLLERQQEGHALAMSQSERRYEKLLEWAIEKDAELDRILQSRSWKATAFLRRLSGFFRR